MTSIDRNLVPFTDTFTTDDEDRVHLSNGDSFSTIGPVSDRIVHLCYSFVIIIKSIAFLIVDTKETIQRLGSLFIPSEESLKEKAKALGICLLDSYVFTPRSGVIELIIFVFGIFFPNNARKIIFEVHKTGLIDFSEHIKSFDYKQRTT